MGATCCKAATHRKHPPPHVSPLCHPGSSVACAGRTIARHSPSWSFRWDHRTHIEDDDLVHSNGESESGNDFFCSEIGPSRKPDNLEDMNDSSKSKVGSIDQSMVSSSSSPEIKELSKNASTSAPVAGPTPSDIEPSKRPQRSPGYTLYRQVSDSRIPSLKSSFNSLSNLSRSPDPFYSLSNNSSSDNNNNWSMHVFSQLVGSVSQRDMSMSPSSFNSSQELQPCKICARLLNERSIFGGQKIGSCRENPAAVAVLACGHAYHADCLESVTTEADRYEPSCPVCSSHGGDRFGAKFSAKCKISKNAVVDLDVVDMNMSPRNNKGIGSSKGKGVKRSSGRPFLKRHFSLGSSRNETERKAWFWGRYRKELRID